MENIQPNTNTHNNNSNFHSVSGVSRTHEQLKDFGDRMFRLLDVDQDGYLGDADLVGLSHLLNQMYGSPSGHQQYDVGLLKDILTGGQPHRRVDSQAITDFTLKYMSGFVGRKSLHFGHSDTIANTTTTAATRERTPTNTRDTHRTPGQLSLLSPVAVLSERTSYVGSEDQRP